MTGTMLKTKIKIWLDKNRSVVVDSIDHDPTDRRDGCTAHEVDVAVRLD